MSTSSASEGTSYFASKDEKTTSNEINNTITSYDGTSKHTPYFNQFNSKQLRKTNLEMKINFGANNALSKTIKHIYLRSSSVEVDASGNPIYESYEFIAQDVIEAENVFKK